MILKLNGPHELICRQIMKAGGPPDRSLVPDRVAPLSLITYNVAELKELKVFTSATLNFGGSNGFVPLDKSLILSTNRFK